jgi:hypothetical protein
MLGMEVFDHPTRMVTLSESAAADEPKGLSLNSMTRATSPVGSGFRGPWVAGHGSLIADFLIETRCE